MMLVHKNERQTNRLINHLSNDFDIFVHIDKRCSLKINKSKNVFIFKKYKTYWGSFNQIIATLYLLRKAFEKGYDRYLLISGQDLPLKTNEEIKNFFQNNIFEYVDINKIPNSDGWPNMNRLTAFNLDNRIHGMNINYRIIKIFYRLEDKIINKIFSIISKYFPRKLDYDFCGGANWTNYTHNCVRKILNYLENDKKYIKRYLWTSCADEIFYQTIIAKLDGLKIENNYLRYIDWESGPEYPKILREEDYEKIIVSKALFARKFDENVDKYIIEKIYKKIGEIEKVALGTCHLN
jgi:hypothetical protein